VYDKSYPQSAAVAVLFTAKMDRTTRKYGERGYRYALFEAGHAMQNLCLGAQSLGLSCRPYGGFIEDKADELLGVHDDETTLYLGFVGRSSTVPTDVGDDQRTDQATKSDGTNDEDISGEQYE
jgi:SagB-type dehydrogenase family enzyme